MEPNERGFAISDRRAAWGLYLISDEAMVRDGSFLALLEAGLGAGLRVVQLRAKSLTDETFLEVGARVRRLTRRYGADFIVNDRADLVLPLDADGVHVGQADPSPRAVRETIGPNRIVGLSTHNRAQILAASKEPVDYIGVGPIYPTQSKENPDPVAGVELLEWANRRSAIPIVAIGGITLDDLDAVLRTGAPNVAVISAISRSDDPEATMLEFIRRIDGRSNPSPRGKRNSHE